MQSSCEMAFNVWLSPQEVQQHSGEFSSSFFIFVLLELVCFFNSVLNLIVSVHTLSFKMCFSCAKSTCNLLHILHLHSLFEWLCALEGNVSSLLGSCSFSEQQMASTRPTSEIVNCWYETDFHNAWHSKQTRSDAWFWVNCSFFEWS